MARDPFEDRWRKTQEEPQVVKSPRRAPPGQAIANALGLSAEATSDGAMLSGYVNGLEMHIVLRVLSSGYDIWARMRGKSLPLGLEIAPQHSDLLAIGDLRTGDADLDARTLVRGAEVEVISVLDHETRTTVLELLPRGFTIDNGEGLLSGRYQRGRGLDTMFALEVRRAARLVSEMSLSRRKPGKRLRNIAKHDPVVGVRRRAYGLLEKHFPELLDEEVARAQKYPRDIRWRLGLRINPDLAEALADAVEDTHASDEERARALRRLARIEPFRHFAKQVDIAFAEEGELRDAAVEVLSHADLADTPYAAFGESSLLVLTVIGSRAQKLSAITELGARGTERAIEPLLEFAAGFFVRRVLKQAAREAIAAIEKRTGIGRGFLSVAPVRGGELSQSDHADEGAVTIVEDPE